MRAKEIALSAIRTSESMNFHGTTLFLLPFGALFCIFLLDEDEKP
jgi:hypothetical protein